MTTATDDKVKQFLASFDGDVVAARAALDGYERQQNSDAKIRQDLAPNKHEQLDSADTPGAAHQSQPTSDEIISVQQVSKRYTLGKQTVDALREVTLSIGKGEFVAITGASGSGKSTLLQIIGCLDKPTSGRVAVESKETTHLSDNALSELRQHAIGFIFQSFYLQPFLRLNDNLAVPAMFTHEKKKDIDARVDKLLQQVDLTERASIFRKSCRADKFSARRLRGRSSTTRASYWLTSRRAIWIRQIAGLLLIYFVRFATNLARRLSS